jgi:hypothetical protein
MEKPGFPGIPGKLSSLIIESEANVNVKLLLKICVISTTEISEPFC